MALEFEPIENVPAPKSQPQAWGRGRLVFEPLGEGETGKERIGEYVSTGAKTAGEQFMSGVKPAMETAGGLFGAVAGTPAGPGGMVAGATLGASGMSALYDNIRNAFIAAGLVEGKPKTPGEVTEGAAKAGATEFAFGAGYPAVSRGYNILKAKGLGVSKEAAELGNVAREHGINLGVSDVSTSPIPRGYERVAGVFPIVGGPIRKAAERKVQEVAAAQDRLFSGIGDIKGITDVGEELSASAKARYGAFKKAADDKYEAWRKLAKDTGATLPTDRTREAATKFVNEYDAARAAYIPKPGEEAAVDAVKEPAFITQARQMMNLTPRMDVAQYEGLMRDFDAALQQSRKDGYNFRNVEIIRQAAKDDFSKIDRPEVRTAKDLADKWFAENVKKFETPTAKKFELVDKTAFDVGFEQAGTRNADELLPLAFNTKSPKAMKDLRNLVGEKPMQNAVASYLEGAYDKALVETTVRGNPVRVIDPEKFRAAIGLDRPGSAQWKTLDAALEQAGSSVRAADLDRFVRAVEAAVKRGAPDPSTFLARRAVLGGGIGALETALPLGAAYAAGNPLPLAMFFLGRGAAGRLTNPRHLRDITDLVHPQTPERYKNIIAGRLLRGIAAEGLLDTVSSDE